MLAEKDGTIKAVPGRYIAPAWDNVVMSGISALFIAYLKGALLYV